jgi:hypothetical protein
MAFRFPFVLGTVLLAAILVGEARCLAGGLVTIGPNWCNFVFEPKLREPTPNYYGYGARISAGYSIDQMVDLALYGQYSPGRLNSASTTETSAAVYDYGGEIGVRVFDVLYIGAHGGTWNYRLLRRSSEEEVGGAWSGPGGGLSFGMILPVNKEVKWQATLDLGQAVVTKTNKAADDVDLKSRNLSRASVTVSLVYNGYESGSTWNALFN